MIGSRHWSLRTTDALTDPRALILLFAIFCSSSSICLKLKVVLFEVKRRCLLPQRLQKRRSKRRKSSFGTIWFYFYTRTSARNKTRYPLSPFFAALRPPLERGQQGCFMRFYSSPPWLVKSFRELSYLAETAKKEKVWRAALHHLQGCSATRSFLRERASLPVQVLRVFAADNRSLE